ncbi:oxygen-dependent coproporphyrinogen-III oxidase [Novimethylophilus kurashikiensis]|uniref:Oxygen-dependent coproporphyrinogen-III oxidase n=1 Tax=Novimethylophilus kurashikiensis TaxID=1825523 RepID=A0A2R5FAA0_9PROT|nr:YggL family protein [Novimethylophilus kurashikiensis]GBG14955.1 oxygen-dependent coproporphyrinogen-III oxidase [Novimethylophilus kurashikiensis]
MAKQRSRRLRKKLRVDEFQELGFELEVALNQGLTPEGVEALVDAFLAEVIEPRDLAFAGWATGGYVCKFSRGSATEEDRSAAAAWLKARPEVEAVRASELQDAWYV